jgi:ATP-binding cassette subfamily B protein
MRAVDRFVAELPSLRRVVVLAARASPRSFVLWISLVCVHGLVPGLAVWWTRDVADAAADVVSARASDASLHALLPPLVRLAAVLLLGEIVAAALGWARALQAERLRDHVTALIHEKSLVVDLAFHDAPAFHDRLHRARDAGADGPIVLLESLGSTLEHALTLVSLGAVLAPFGAMVPIALLVSVVPAGWIVVSTALALHRWRTAATPRIRRATYLDDLLTHPLAAAELRLYDLGPLLRQRYVALRTTLRDEQLVLERRAAIARLGASTLTLAIAGTTVLVVAQRAIGEGATLGALVVLAQSFVQGQRVVAALLANAGTIYRHALSTAALFDFLALAGSMPIDASPIALPAAESRAVRFEQVSFRYPGSTRLALDGLDLELPKGRMAAIVGTNGAGKSTLVKLAARLYDPEKGRVTLDGVDLRSLDLDALRAELAVLLQDPLRFSSTARENIALGDRGADDVRLAAAIEAAGAGAILARMPDGLDTQLGSWLGGVELSVGEWQRLALARASLRRASLIVLDEPTSAMDSWAEAEWLERLRAITAGRTVLLVTHRFTTAMRADVIHVVDAGRVVESGTHAELVAQGGRYAKSWRAQVEAATAS